MNSSMIKQTTNLAGRGGGQQELCTSSFIRNIYCKWRICERINNIQISNLSW